MAQLGVDDGANVIRNEESVDLEPPKAKPGAHMRSRAFYKKQ